MGDWLIRKKLGRWNSNRFPSHYADLSDADLKGANFTNANLTNVDFEDAWLTNVHLTDADLTGVDLEIAVNVPPEFLEQPDPGGDDAPD